MPSGVVGVADIDNGDCLGSGRGKEEGGEGRSGHTVESWEGLHGRGYLKACGTLYCSWQGTRRIRRADYVNISFSGAQGRDVGGLMIIWTSFNLTFNIDVLFCFEAGRAIDSRIMMERVRMVGWCRIHLSADSLEGRSKYRSKVTEGWQRDATEEVRQVRV